MSETIEVAEFKRVEMKVGRCWRWCITRGRQTLHRPDRRGWRSAVGQTVTSLVPYYSEEGADGQRGGGADQPQA